VRAPVIELSHNSWLAPLAQEPAAVRAEVPLEVALLHAAMSTGSTSAQPADERHAPVGRQIVQPTGLVAAQGLDDVDRPLAHARQSARASRGASGRDRAVGRHAPDAVVAGVIRSWV
jgi:hypothetical protein